MFPPRAFTAFSAVRGLGADVTPLGVHMVALGVVRPDRQERARSDMQRDEMLGRCPGRQAPA